MQRPDNLVNVDNLKWADITRKDRLLFRRKALGRDAGGELLGTSLYEVPPGDRLWTYHYHCANEEAIYILDGAGTVRLPDGEYPIGKGDFMAFPRGPAGAHVIVAGPDAPLRLLAISTMHEPEVNGYPDSEKVSIYAGSAPGGDPSRRYLSLFLRTDDEVDYWHGEE